MRQKRVFDNPYSVARLWRDQVQNDARNKGGNFYFYGKTIYSYGSHFPIATHTKDAKGNAAILFTTRSYSTTNAGHIGAVRSAVDDVVYVAHPLGHPDENFAAFASEAKQHFDKLVKARKPEIYAAKIREQRERAEIYAAFLGCEIPSDIASILNVSDKQTAQAYLVAKRLKEAAQAY